MIKTFKYKNGQIKVTYDEPLMVRDHPYDQKRHQIEIVTFPISQGHWIGVELELDRGGRICYGMLAAGVEPGDEMNGVEIQIVFTQENTVRYHGSCLYDDRYVYKGLPEGYVDPIIQSATAAILEKGRYPRCKILFGYAANCEVGSSPMIYRMIAGIILDLIFEDAYEKIMDMDTKTFTEGYAKNVGLRY